MNKFDRCARVKGVFRETSHDQRTNVTDTKISRAYLKGVCKEIMVEHWPVLAADVHNDFAEFVTDEIGHGFMLSKEEFGQTAANIHLVL